MKTQFKVLAVLLLPLWVPLFVLVASLAIAKYFFDKFSEIDFDDL